MPETNGLLWTQREWVERVHGWIDAQLAARGIARAGPIEQPHVRPWSTVMRVPTSTGDLYFKANATALRHEAAVVGALARWRPGAMPRLLASDVKQGWLLLADGGTRLRHLLRSEADLRRWETILPQYAELQIACARRHEELSPTGLPDRRLAGLPTHLEELVNDPQWVGLDRPLGLQSDEHRRLLKYVARFKERCERLSARGIPASLDHGDLHDGNVFVQDGRYLFFDWGDSSITHPFFSLRTTFVSLENGFALGADSVWFERLTACYLEPWTAFGTGPELATTFELAQRLAPVVAALRWRDALSMLQTTPRPDYAAAIPSLLRELLSADGARQM